MKKYKIEGGIRSGDSRG